jgi:hypothetical protein
MAEIASGILVLQLVDHLNLQVLVKPGSYVWPNILWQF